MSRRIVVTGANGFIGRALMATLASHGFEVVPLARAREMVACEAVVHTAGISCGTLPELMTVNATATARLAREAAQRGVRRFVLLSTIKVHGAGRAEPYTERAPIQCAEAYAASKWQAEVSLQRIGTATGLETVVIRPALVYGPGVKGNLRRLNTWLQLGWPLPLAGINNARHLLAQEALLRLIILTLTHPDAPSASPFVAADQHPISTPELCRALQPAVRLQRWPSWLLSALLGQATYQRLAGNYLIDCSHTASALGWQPVQDSRPGLARVC